MTRAADHSGTYRRFVRALGPTWAVIGKAALSGALIALVVAAIILLREATPGHPLVQDRPEPRYVVHESDAGYSFRYPSGWSVEQQGRVTTVEPRSGDAVVSFGIGAPQSPLVQAGTYMMSLRAAYNDVVTTDSRRYRAGPHPALWMAGEAVNKEDVRLVFLVNIVSKPETAIYLASAFVPAGEDELLRDAKAIASSLRARHR